MFKVKADPTFAASLNIVGQGREQTLNVVFKHKTRTEYAEMLERMSKGKLSSVDALLALLDSWDADMELSRESVAALQEHQPGVDWAIIQTYGEALTVARKGN